LLITDAGRDYLAVVRDVLREPMFLLLLATGVVYLILGSHEEAIALSGAILVVIGITVYQERKTEQTKHPLALISQFYVLLLLASAQEVLLVRLPFIGDIGR
jgi:Ca2+-transporting ATPase